MKLSFDLKKAFRIASHSVNIILCACLIVVILLSVFVVKQSVDIVRGANDVVLVPKTSLVRVNFGLYNQIIERLDQQQVFQPTPVTSRNPFGIVDPAKATP
jgi:hypothetical protein